MEREIACAQARIPVKVLKNALAFCSCKYVLFIILS